MKKGKDAPAALDPARLAEDQVAETVSPDFPGERLLVCLNGRKGPGKDLLRATERWLRSPPRRPAAGRARRTGR